MRLPRIKDLVLATKTQRLQFLDSVSALIDSTDASMSKPTGHESNSNLAIAMYVIENIDNLILLGVVDYTAVDAAAFHKALSSVNGPQELAQQMLDKMATERTIADNVVFDAEHAELYRDYTEQIDVNGGLSPEASNLWLSFEQTASTILPFVTTALNLQNSGRSQQQVRDAVSTQVRNIADVSGYSNLAVIQEIINVLMIDGIEEVDASASINTELIGSPLDDFWVDGGYPLEILTLFLAGEYGFHLEDLVDYMNDEATDNIGNGYSEDKSTDYAVESGVSYLSASEFGPVAKQYDINLSGLCYSIFGWIAPTDEYDLVTPYKQKFYDVVASGTSYETPKIVEVWEEMSEIDEAGLYLIIARFLDAIDPYDKNAQTTADTVSARIEAKKQLIEKFGIDGNVIGKILQRFYLATGLGGLLSFMHIPN